MIDNKYEGNDHLCSFELKMWSLVQEIIFRWSTLVVFKWTRMHVSNYTSGLIEFFVPADCTHRYEIEAFLNYELEREKEDPVDMKFDDGSGKIPGRDVKVTTIIKPFRGVPGHVDRDISEKMAREAGKRFIMEIKKM